MGRSLSEGKKVVVVGGGNVAMTVSGPLSGSEKPDVHLV
jgi:NADPH-dependent glutamate synthase beta subunit-like oxidoreductase